MKNFETTNKHQYSLFKLHMLDLQVLLEMEWNGLLYNKDKSLALAEDYDTKVAEIEDTLNRLVDFEINWNSNAEKSSVLYGGDVKRTTKVPVGVFKSGQRIGDIKYKNLETSTSFPRLVSPLKINNDEDNLSVAEPVLRSLRPKKAVAKLIDLILERAKMEKLNGTYLKGLPKKLEEMNWGTILHPSYNNCVAVTGRVASSNPNGQNIPPIGKQLCESRYK
jgi:DNA polymerase I-like protein with 3'-5' exonuclease and polymerase domains